MGKLDGKVAIITGAASGIGKATVERFLKEGAKVVASDINEEGLKALVDEVQSDSLVTLAGDISKYETNKVLVELAVKHFGKLDILVNNAGVMDNFKTVAEADDDLWKFVMGINLMGPVYGMKEAINYFLKNNVKGSIISTGSVASLRGSRGGAIYTASKHALLGVVENTAHMYAKEGIRCNLIAAGSVETNIMTNAKPEDISPRGMAPIQAGLPTMPRSGKPEEIAGIAVFLASDDASFITGSTILADGGWLAF